MTQVFIYKILPKQLWQAAHALGHFAGSAVDQADGFIHFSASDQVGETAARHFSGQANLVLLKVDAASLGSALKWEISRNGGLFPHLYGDLPLAAVVRAEALPCMANGSHDFTGLIE